MITCNFFCRLYSANFLEAIHRRTSDLMLNNLIVCIFAINSNQNWAFSLDLIKIIHEYEYKFIKDLVFHLRPQTDIIWAAFHTPVYSETPDSILPQALSFAPSNLHFTETADTSCKVQLLYNYFIFYPTVPP